MNSLTTEQKKNYEATKAMGINNHKYRVWMQLYIHEGGRSVQEIVDALHYEESEVIRLLHELLTARRVCCCGLAWWVYDSSFHPVVE
jgi:transposase-like protein